MLDYFPWRLVGWAGDVCISEQSDWSYYMYAWGVITAKILFQILLCRTCVVYKFFAEKTRI